MLDAARRARRRRRSSPALPFTEFFVGHERRASSGASSLERRGDHILEAMHARAVLGRRGCRPSMMAIGFARRLATSTSAAPGHARRGSRAQHDALYRFLLNKWYFDELYDLLFVRPALWLGRVLWKGGDGCVIDGFGPGRRLGARPRRHPQRRAAADRLPLPLRLRHADRRRRPSSPGSCSAGGAH